MAHPGIFVVFRISIHYYEKMCAESVFVAVRLAAPHVYLKLKC